MIFFNCECSIVCCKRNRFFPLAKTGVSLILVEFKHKLKNFLDLHPFYPYNVEITDYIAKRHYQIIK